MREWLREFLESLIIIVLLAAMFFCFTGLITWGLGALLGVGDLHNTWTESAEFSQLMTGQDRFSEHETNVSRWVVVVDHATGNQYIASVDGDAICPILDVDGTPLRVMEAADDGEEK